MRIVFSVALMTLLVLSASFAPAAAQMSASDVVVRMEALEHQIRQLTGQIEQLQFRNQQLEQQVRRSQEDNEFRFQELGGKGGARTAQPAQPAQPPQARPQPQSQPPAQQAQPPLQPVAPQPLPGRRSEAGPRGENPNFVATPNPTRPGDADRADSPGVGAPPPSSPQVAGRRDVFDPNANPSAPGAPRALGSLPAGQPSAPPGPIAADEPVGGRGARDVGAPLDISTMSGGAAAGEQRDPQGAGLPPPPQRNLSSTGALASAGLPSQSPKDHYDLGYGYIQRKDYAAAEQSFRDFVQRYPGDRLSPDAQYWIGESLFQRQRYRDAAESFLTVSTKHETSGKAPDSLLRLGQSLAALREKDAACATFGEIGRKYPRASLSVKQGVEREQKRVGC
jgi:tol-pal system protein YbgF